MNKFLKRIILAFSVIVLIIVFTPAFAKISVFFSGARGGSWIISSKLADNIDGSLMAYAFFIPLMLSIFGGKNKYKIIGVLVGLELFLFLGHLETLIIDAVAVIIGWLLGEGILFAYKKLVPVKTDSTKDIAAKPATSSVAKPNSAKNSKSAGKTKSGR